GGLRQLLQAQGLAGAGVRHVGSGGDGVRAQRPAVGHGLVLPGSVESLRGDGGALASPRGGDGFSGGVLLVADVLAAVLDGCLFGLLLAVVFRLVLVGLSLVLGLDAVGQAVDLLVALGLRGVLVGLFGADSVGDVRQGFENIDVGGVVLAAVVPAVEVGDGRFFQLRQVQTLVRGVT